MKLKIGLQPTRIRINENLYHEDKSFMRWCVTDEDEDEQWLPYYAPMNLDEEELVKAFRDYLAARASELSREAEGQTDGAARQKARYLAGEFGMISDFLGGMLANAGIMDD